MPPPGTRRGPAAWLARVVSGVPLEPAAEEVYERERRAHNRRAAVVVMLVLVPVHLLSVVVYWRDVGPRGAPEDFHATVSLVHLLALPWIAALTALLVLVAPRWRRPGLTDAGTDLFALSYVLLGAVLSANAQRLNGNVNVLMIALLGSGVVLRQRGVSAIVIPAAGLVCFFALVPLVQDDPARRLAAFAPAIATSVIAVVASRLTVAAARAQIATRLTIEAQRAELAEKRDELGRLNQRLEERVAAQVDEIVARAREIEKLNHHLRAQVIDRSRQLAHALRGAGPRAERALAEGELLDGRVEIGARIGAGAMGEVYRGADRILGRDVAVKVPRADSGVSTDVWVRFAAEAEAAAAVHHPVVVHTLHVGITDDGRLYQLQELVDGVSLSTTLAEGATWPPAHAARLAAAIADALATAHAAGVVHRDVKPGNVMLTATPPGVRLLDFGISKVHEGGAGEAVGEVIGTPAFMAPEQITAPTAVGSAADVYALGALIAELVTGAPPFLGDGRAQMHAHVHQPAPRLPPARAPADLADLVARCLDKDPARRPTAREAHAALTAIADAGGAPAAHALPRPQATLPPQGATVRLQPGSRPDSRPPRG